MIGLLVEVGLILLPCGCVAEAEIQPQDGIFECPWCAATFSLSEFRNWIPNALRRPLFLEHGPKLMLRYGGELLEVEGEHEGHPVVRVGDKMTCVQQFEWVSN